MINYSKAVDKVYDEVSRFIILGLTGRTGSGCTTAANFLSSDTINIPQSNQIYNTFNDRKKYRIVKEYMSNNWTSFITIHITTIITKSILCLKYEAFTEFLSLVVDRPLSEVVEELNGFEGRYKALHEEIEKLDGIDEEIPEGRNQKIEEAWPLYFETLPTFTQEFKRILQERLGVDSYVKLYQAAGDNVRASGSANDSQFKPENLFLMPRIINQLVKVIKVKNKKEDKDKTFIVIDAIRNPYEADFFKQRHANFFLFAINTPNSERLNHLRESHKFSEGQIKKLDLKEYPKKLLGKGVFISQNIQKCLEAADVHINNPTRDKHDINELTSQLVWYLSLILHPGLVTPTSTERCMQLAFSSKINSGCISRQVGAVISDEHYSIKAVGWNSVPQGQTPCLFRSAKELINNEERDTYSEYEKQNDEFRRVLNQSFSGIANRPELGGRNLPFCFKDLQNEVEGEKNQVHTRSLHAEENAFLQLSKFGGQPIKGGLLFTTASPCELCSKKAYQLGLSHIYFIDPYPGIANEHILNCGNNVPEMHLFSGAIGKAYHRLYQPIMPFKDELRLLTDFTITGGTKKNKKDQKIKHLEEEILKLKAKIIELQNGI